MTTANSSDVLVLGGGIIGLTLADRLARCGATVTVLDRQEFGREASWAGAGILPPGNPERAATPLDRLRAVGVTRFAAFSHELKERTGIDNGYVRCGGIEIVGPEDGDAVGVWRAEGLQVEPIRSAPGFTLPADTPTYFLPDFAQVRNPWHVRALVASCRHAGVTLLPHTHAREWLRDGQRVTGVRTGAGDLSAGQFVIASGAWAAEHLAPLGCALPVFPVRGQIVLYRTESLPFRPVVLHGKRYLVPRPDGRILVGSTEEPQAGFEKANTPDGIAELRHFAESLCPALGHAEVEATWSGLRPGSPDGLPSIGPVPGMTNVFAAVGHFRAGVQLSFGTAEVMTSLLIGTASPVDPAHFRLDRPPTEARPAFRS